MAKWPNTEERVSIYKSVFGDASPDQYFLGMVILSCTVATYGLLSNSTAIVIGAMLIAPLMGPILGGALAVATNNLLLLKISAKAEALGAITAIVLSALLTLILPQAELTPEVMGRTTPTILDLVVALASGAAGTYAICVKPQGATLPGAAIATALMPPLCVVGIGLAKQNFPVVSGSFLLFLANMIAINVAAIAMFEVAGFSNDFCRNGICTSEKENRTRYRILFPVILLIVISIPLAFIMFRTYSQASTEKVIHNSLTESLDMIAPHSTLISSKYDKTDNRFVIDAAFRTTKIIDPENIRQMENLLELRLGKPVKISADVVLVQKVNDTASIDTFQSLLPKITEKQVVEVVKSSTPEEVIDNVLKEKIALISNAKLDDYTLEYSKSSGTYMVTVKVISEAPLDEKMTKTIRNILEERLKRRVDVRFIVINNLSK